MKTKSSLKECKKCKRLYDTESFNDRAWHKESWGCEEHEPNRGDESEC